MSTSETAEIRKAIFAMLNDRIEDRPCSASGTLDGNWKYIHHLRAKSAVDSQIPSIEKLEAERDELRAAVAGLKAYIQQASKPSEAQIRASELLSQAHEEIIKINTDLRAENERLKADNVSLFQLLADAVEVIAKSKGDK